MILLTYGHGLRTEEVCELRVGDLKDGILSVQRRKRSMYTSQPLLRHGKDPLFDEVFAVDQWLKQRPCDDSDVLFPSRNGGALHRSQFFRIFQAIATKAGLPPEKRHPRVLKYSLAWHLLAGNMDINRVTEILGHRSLHSTMQYARAAKRQMTQPAEAFPVYQSWRQVQNGLEAV